MTEPDSQFCVLCPTRERIPYRGRVCEACRRWLHSMIGDVHAYADDLTAPVDLVPDLRTIPAPFGPRLRAWHDLDQDATVRRRDYINAILPSGSAGNPTRNAPVSGSREPAMPINADAVDILMPPRQGSVPATVLPAMIVDSDTVKHHYIRIVDGQPEYVVEEVTGLTRRFAIGDDGFPVFVDALDQIGHLPLAAVLDSWVRDWREIREAGEGLPDAHIADMTRWLQTRTDWACDNLDAEILVSFADEIRSYRSAMAGILGIVDVPDYKYGVACPKCASLTLFRRIGGPADGSLWVECSTCTAMLSPSEYEEWTMTRAAQVRDSADNPMVDLEDPLVTGRTN